MEDELNMDPRETDYADDYDMVAAMNFFELEKQLAKLGYESPNLPRDCGRSFGLTITATASSTGKKRNN